MLVTAHRLSIDAVRSEALFVSTVQPSERPGPARVRRAVAVMVRELGARECVGRVAQEFGDHPEVALVRMRWARRLIRESFGRRGTEAAHPAGLGGVAVARAAGQASRRRLRRFCAAVLSRATDQIRGSSSVT
jgi:hypothetical protein